MLVCSFFALSICISVYGISTTLQLGPGPEHMDDGGRIGLLQHMDDGGRIGLLQAILIHWCHGFFAIGLVFELS